MQSCGDVAGTLIPIAQSCKCAHVFLLPWSEPIEAYTKKTLVKIGNSEFAGGLYAVQRDRRNKSKIPRFMPPLLQEIWIPLGVVQDFPNCRLGKFYLMNSHRALYRTGRILFI